MYPVRNKTALSDKYNIFGLNTDKEFLFSGFGKLIRSEMHFVPQMQVKKSLVALYNTTTCSKKMSILEVCTYRS